MIKTHCNYRCTTLDSAPYGFMYFGNAHCFMITQRDNRCTRLDFAPYGFMYVVHPSPDRSLLHRWLHVFCFVTPRGCSAPFAAYQCTGICTRTGYIRTSSHALRSRLDRCETYSFSNIDIFVRQFWETSLNRHQWQGLISSLHLWDRSCSASSVINRKFISFVSLGMLG